MKHFLLVIGFFGFALTTWAQCDNLKPMYGDNCEKNAKLRKLDEQFRNAALKQHGSADSAAKAYVQTGWKYFHDRDAETAMKRFNQAWLLDPQNADVYFAFGHLTRYAFEKKSADAERYYKLGRLRDPKKEAEKNSLLNLLTSLENRKDPEAAVDASSQLIVNFPEYGKGFGYKKRGFYYTTLQMPDRAILDYEKALEIDPQDANSYIGRGYAYSWQRNHQQALADYNKAILLDPKAINAYVSRAVLYTDSLNQPANALPDIEKAMQLAPKEAAFYKMKSNALLKLDRKTEACACLQNGIAAGHKSLETEFKAKCSK